MNTEPSKIESQESKKAGLIDAAGWGVLFIWIGAAALANLGWSMGLLGTGIVALGVQAARNYLGLPMNRAGLVLGIFFAAVGILQMLNIRIDETPIGAKLFPIFLITVGIVILGSMWMRKSPNP